MLRLIASPRPVPLANSSSFWKRSNTCFILSLGIRFSRIFDRQKDMFGVVFVFDFDISVSGKFCRIVNEISNYLGQSETVCVDNGRNLRNFFEQFYSPEASVRDVY